MNNVKAYIFPIAAGFGVACIALMINLFLFSSDNASKFKTNNDEFSKISYRTFDNTDEMLDIALSLFNATHVNDSELAGESLLSLSEDLTVRIVAQASVGNQLKTLLEVTSAKESKRLMVQEGIVINGLLIKKITSKALIVEKDTVEHTIKLFHPKELNSTNTEQKNDIK